MRVKSLFEKMDISKKKHLSLYFIWNSLVFLLASQVELIGVIHYIYHLDLFEYFFCFMLGILCGLLVSILLSDNIKKPLGIIKYLMIVATILLVLQAGMILNQTQYQTFLKALFIITTSLTLMGFMLYMKIFLISTK